VTFSQQKNEPKRKKGISATTSPSRPWRLNQQRKKDLSFEVNINKAEKYFLLFS